VILLYRQAMCLSTSRLGGGVSPLRADGPGAVLAGRDRPAQAAMR
jgi:hypothetical protein